MKICGPDRRITVTNCTIAENRAEPRSAAASACIDSGDRTSPVGSEPRPNGGTINLRAHGGTSQASRSYLSPSQP